MKKLLTLALIVLSANSFAQINHGRLLKHQEWTTGDARVVFKPEAKAFKNPNQERSSVFTYAELMPLKVNASEMSNVSGHHGISIRNDTANTQKYSVEFGICVDTDVATKQCGYYGDDIELEPNGEYQFFTTPVLNLIFNKPGTYKTEAYSFISGDQLELIHSATENRVEVS